MNEHASPLRIGHCKLKIANCQRIRLSRRNFHFAILNLQFAILLSGCAGYRFGTASLYPPDIQTVFVPMFESDSLRRGLGERLTEAVIKEIELKTPYKVVSDPNADSVLTGRILNDLKRVTVEDPFDQPRENEITLLAEVSWVDRRGDLIGSRGNIPLPESLVTLAGTGKAVPEFGQSIATGQQQAIDRMAEQIVSLMETPW